MGDKINFKEIPQPKKEETLYCPVCGGRMFDIEEYENHYKEHQKTGLPFVVSISLPPED